MTLLPPTERHRDQISGAALLLFVVLREPFARYIHITMRKRGHTLPRAIVSAFVASIFMLMIGIHQTSHISSQKHSHDVSFDPPVPALMHGRLLKNVSNTSVNVSRRRKTAGERERQAREAARANNNND